MYSHLLHGLKGDPKNTWTSHQTDACWLQELLRHDILNASVMKVSHNADTVFSETTADIMDHAKGLLSSLVDRLNENDVRCWYLMNLRDAKAEPFA